MAESTYHITLTNDGGGVYTPVARRGGTAASGGTSLTIPHIDNANTGSADTTTKMILHAIRAAGNAVVNDRADGN